MGFDVRGSGFGFEVWGAGFGVLGLGQYPFAVQALAPLSNDLKHNKPVRARLRPWLSGKITFKLSPLCSAAAHQLAGLDGTHPSTRNRTPDLAMEPFRASWLNHSATRDRRLRLATQDCYSRKATMGGQLMAPRTNRTTRIPSGVTSPITTKHAAKGSLFVDLRNTDNLKQMQVHKIHVLMAALCFVKAACLLFESVRFSSIKKTVSSLTAVFS